MAIHPYYSPSLLNPKWLSPPTTRRVYSFVHVFPVFSHKFCSYFRNDLQTCIILSNFYCLRESSQPLFCRWPKANWSPMRVFRWPFSGNRLHSDRKAETPHWSSHRRNAGPGQRQCSKKSPVVRVARMHSRLHINSDSHFPSITKNIRSKASHFHHQRIRRIFPVFEEIPQLLQLACHPEGQKAIRLRVHHTHHVSLALNLVSSSSSSSSLK